VGPRAYWGVLGSLENRKWYHWPDPSHLQAAVLPEGIVAEYEANSRLILSRAESQFYIYSAFRIFCRPDAFSRQNA
jgi:hypothetical protein